MFRFIATLILLILSPIVAGAEVLKEDTVWSKEVIVTKSIVVPEGVTLTVLPGTRVIFGKGAGIEIFGRIESKGRKNKRITYTAVDSKEPGYWNEISLQQAGESFFAYSDFSFATWAIHSHFTALKISGCSFTGNYGGIRFRSGPLEIKNSIFRENKIGIRSFRGTGQISRNEIRDNEIGIFVREKGAGLAIHNNNIYANERYSLRLGDFNRQEVDARHNWWGGEDPAEVIFDRADESYIGPVHFEPVLSGPVDIIDH